ncbi:restriction endonuclease subunit S [Aquimarina algiphila]|uniref:restriction endonuclease subunit S n=1 Tax=Aquimarina algiphila TaxID=2047982 RepID=UPI00232E0247|nr:restriction endonuclease subunit S [Aquimarina algiphila]
MGNENVLDQYIDILSGYAFKPKFFNSLGDGLPLIRVRDVNSGFSGKYYSGPYHEKFVINDGDILVGMDGDFKCVEWNYGKALLNQRVCKIVPKINELNKKYLLHFLPKELEEIHRKTTYTTVKHLSAKQIKGIKINKPSLSNQKRIAQVLTDCEVLIAKRKQSIDLLNELVKSTFLEMFGDPVKNEKGWKKTILNKVCTKITDGTHHSPPIQDEGIPYITAKHISENNLDFWSKPWYISKEDHKVIFSRCNPEKGDILYIKDGATTGKSCINTYDFEFSLLSSVALLKPDRSLILKEYLNSWLNNPIVKQKIISKMAGGAIKRLTLRKIKDIQILLPPLQIQNQFAQIVEKVEETKILYQNHLNELENLYGRLSQDVFKGELDLSKVVLRDEFLADEEVVSPKKISKEQKTYKKIKIDKSYLKESSNNTKTKRDITNMTLADFYGIPDEIQATQEDLDFQFRGDDLFYQFLLKDHFKDKSFDYQDLQDQFQSYFIQKDFDMEYESWKKVIFKFIEATPPLIKQEFDEQKGRIKLKLTDEAFKA